MEMCGDCIASDCVEKINPCKCDCHWDDAERLAEEEGLYKDQLIREHLGK